MKRIKPVHLDGALWVLLALWAAQQQMLSSEEAYKYVNPYALFWWKFALGSATAACTALKAFRSTAFARHREEVKSETQFLQKDQP